MTNYPTHDGPDEQHAPEPEDEEPDEGWAKTQRGERESRRKAQGTLYVVSTPIGNLGDLTLRARDTLREVSIVTAEDTRQTRKLLAAYGIHARMLSLHARSSEQRLAAVLAHLEEGADVAYVTDAGSPTVSDPGVELVDAAHQRGLRVCVIPGPSAVTAALAVAGLPTQDFRFIGFLPRSAGKRETTLRGALGPETTVVLFESPHRVRALLETLREVAPNSRVALCRELTKVYEEVLRGTPTQLLDGLPAEPRGEFTIVIGPTELPNPSASGESSDELSRKRIMELLQQGLSTRQAAKTLAQELSIPKKKAYELVLSLKETPES